MSLVTSIQKYSIHDGDGIRTTVFFKGCPLSCVWCHNPETQSYCREILQDSEKCVGCQSCMKACPNGAIHADGDRVVTDSGLCKKCGICIDHCVLNLREVVGKEYTVEELLEQIKKDEMFYEESGGGVTLSGGEVMASDMDYIEKLCKALYRYGISITIDTCGHAPYENFKRILPYVDTFLYDIKTVDPQLHNKYIGKDPALIFGNLEQLSRDGARIYIRIPVIKEVNGTDAAIRDIVSWLRDKHIHAAQINLLPYHNTGSGKYKKLGREYEGKELHTPDAEEMERFTAIFKEAGYHNTKIGG